MLTKFFEYFQAEIARRFAAGIRDGMEQLGAPQDVVLALEDQTEDTDKKTKSRK